MRLTIDSSVYLSALDEKEEKYDQTIAFFKAVTSQQIPIVIPIHVVLELFVCLKRYHLLTDSKIKEFISRFFDDSFTTVVDQDSVFIEKCLEVPFNLPLKTGDYLVAVTSHFADAILITWDQRLEKGAKELVSATNPARFLTEQGK